MAKDYTQYKQNGFLPQKQEDYFSLRIHVIGGNVTAEKFKKICDVAEKYGQGYVHLTSRQSVEVPNIYIDDVEAIKEELAEFDVFPGRGGARVRTITACQGNTVCGKGNIDSYALAKMMDERFGERKIAHKFKMGVTGCSNNCLKAEENDLGVKGAMEVTYHKDKCIYCGKCELNCRDKAITVDRKGKVLLHDSNKCTNCGRCVKACPVDAWTGEEAYKLYFAGLFGNTLHQGEQYLPLLKSKEQVLDIMDAAVTYFEEHGKAKERFMYTIERNGKEEFIELMKQAYERTVK